MPQPLSPLSREHWLKSQEVYVRVLKGEKVPEHEIPDGKPDYRCKPCRDTGFIIEDGLYGTKKSRRCGSCRSRVDAEIKKNATRYVPGTEDIPDDPAPAPRDFKQAAGLDGDE